MDMHGHGHSIQRLELGYLLSATRVNLSDASLDANIAYQDTSGVKTLSEFTHRPSPRSFGEQAVSALSTQTPASGLSPAQRIRDRTATPTSRAETIRGSPALI